MAQQYSLKWNNHQPNFISMFAMLRNSSALVDVTLAAEGRQLHAHKMVLSACSPYFHSLFVENPSRHPIVILKDVAFSDLRTIVDFMYYGEVNITQEELPQMLHSAKSLKVKGLTETESTSVMRSQSAEFAYEASGVGGAGEAAGDACGAGESALESTTGSGQHELASAPSRRTSAEPAEPTAKRKRRRRSSTGSGSAASLHVQPGDEHALTVSSVPPSSTPNARRREYDTHQNAEPQNISIDELSVEHDPAMPPESMSGVRLRRGKHSRLRRQPRVDEPGAGARRQVSAPVAPPHPPALLRKHHSYPQCANAGAGADAGATPTSGTGTGLRQVGSLVIRCVALSGGAPPPPPPPPVGVARARHTPAVRSGPPLSCNFCWNTVDECGRILRRKTQYHCPECRTNLCIVPCFHEYHEPDQQPPHGRPPPSPPPPPHPT